jgi:hypothetical protein
MKLHNKRTLFIIIGAVLVIGLLEMSLNLLALASPRVALILRPPWDSDPIPQIIPDDALGQRPNPAYPGHDRLGFRNPSVPAQADIVALGDSQTYGAGVEAEDAWPRHLQRMTGAVTYSMAYGGYGPPHSLLLLPETVALAPKIIIEAFYAGNDLFDSFDLVYNRGQLPWLKSRDGELQARIQRAEQAEPIAVRVTRRYRMEITDNAPGAESESWTPRRLLARHSKLYGFLRRTRDELGRLSRRRGQADVEAEWDAARAFAAAHPTFCQVFAHGRFRTVFTAEYRLSALDLEDPRIAEGLTISLKVMQKMHEDAVARGIRLLVVLIPTKERVFHTLWQDPPASYLNLIENEELLWKTLKRSLEENGIEYLDAVAALRGQLEAGLQPYRVSHDGHPNAHGHESIARLIAAYLKGER